MSHLIVSVSLYEFLILCLVFLLYHTKAVLSTSIWNRCGWWSPWVPNLFWIVTYRVPKLNVHGSSATEQLKEVISAVLDKEFWLILQILFLLSNTWEMNSSMMFKSMQHTWKLYYLRSNCQLPLQHQTLSFCPRTTEEVLLLFFYFKKDS